jgi:hypothetical protein
MADCVWWRWEDLRFATADRQFGRTICTEELTIDIDLRKSIFADGNWQSASANFKTDPT